MSLLKLSRSNSMKSYFSIMAKDIFNPQGCSRNIVPQRGAKVCMAQLLTMLMKLFAWHWVAKNPTLSIIFQPC